MNKILVIIIIVVILLIGALGLLFMIGSSDTANNPENGQQQNSANNFQIMGMNIEILQEGSGEGAKTGDTLLVNYVGMLADGTQFDASGDTPFEFTVGGRVITGWNLGLVGMKVGEKRKLTIPPDLAYGETGYPPVIPQNATLTFEVELLKIN